MTKPHKIVFLVDSLIPGGVQHGLLLRTRYLSRQKYTPEVWVLRKGGRNLELEEEFRSNGVEVQPALVRHGSDWSRIMRLAEKLAAEKVMLLSTHNFLPNQVGRIAAQLARTPVIVGNYHQTYEYRWNAKFLALEKQVRDATHSFVCVSRAVRDFVQPLLGLPPERVEILYNGFDFTEYDLAKSRAELRRELGLPGDGQLVAYVGRLAPIKDLPTYMRAMPLVLRQIPDARFLLVGAGDERERLERMVAGSDYEDRVHFVGVSRQIPEVMNAIDCLVLPSLIEGFGRVVVEAFAAHTPVVSTPAGGVPEIVEHERNGLLVPFSHPQAMAEAIIKTLMDEDATHARCEQAHLDGLRFDIEPWIRDTEALFDKLFNESRKAVEAQERGDNSEGRARLFFRLLGFRWALMRRRMLEEVRQAVGHTDLQKPAAETN